MFALFPAAHHHSFVEVVLRLFGTLILAFQDPGLAAAAPQADSHDIISLVLAAGPVVKAVLIILMLFSATSWGIIFFKQRQLRRAKRESATFIGVFRKSARFSEVQAVCASLAGSPLVGLFQSGYAELNTQLRGAGEAKPGETASRPTLRSLDAVDRALLRATTTEVGKLEQHVGFLATTASITPYIGLFGTVWGIMGAFQNIAGVGSTSLAVVSQPIAEALIATALGLFAAIPAVYFYNDITSQVKKSATEMDDFSMEFLTIAERNFT